MKNIKVLFALMLVAILSSSFRCNNTLDSACSGPSTNKDLATSLVPFSSQTSFAVGDTLKFSAIISDTLTEINTNNKYIFTIDQLSLTVEIFKVVIPSGSTIPNLQPVFSDFNPIVKDGQVTANNYGYGFKFLYRRLNSNNYLSAGLECGRKGTYIIRFTNMNGYQNNTLYNYSLYPCANFTINCIYGGPQNNSIFATYNISTIIPLPTFTGSAPVSKNDKNYVVITVN